MIGLNHALTGATIGLILQKPLLVVPLAFASHFLLDVIPHFGGHPVYTWGHKHFGKIIATDGLITFIVIALIIFTVPHLALPILLGVVFAMIPDALLVPYYLSGKKPHWFHDFHLNIQWFERPKGVFVEATYLLLLVPLVALLITK